VRTPDSSRRVRRARARVSGSRVIPGFAATLPKLLVGTARRAPVPLLPVQVSVFAALVRSK